MRTLPFSALCVAASLAAQGVPRISVTPFAVDHAARMRNDRPPKGSTCGYSPVPATDPHGVAEHYWYWNRGALLPRPSPRAIPIGGDGVETHVGTSVVRFEHAWLFDAARDRDPRRRALALYAIGCAGPAGRGLPILELALTDVDATVRHAALLGLGEHAGTAARFRLAKEMDDAGRSVEHRRTAALAFGMASAVDGGSGGRALRRFAAADLDGDWRDSACAADRLSGGNALTALAQVWLGNHSEADGSPMPALAITHALDGVPRDQVLARLGTVLDARDHGLRLSARASALALGEVSPAMLERWMAEPAPEHRALQVFAAIGNGGLPALAKKGFASATLRGACALGLALHAKTVGHPNVLEELLAASRHQRALRERPLWLLAIALAGDSSAPARAQALLAEPRTPEPLRLAAADVLALDRDGDRTFLRRAVHLDPSIVVRLVAADGAARHGGVEDVRTIEHAVAHAGTAAERAGLLVALGRTRQPAVMATLRRWCTDPGAPADVELGAWLGLAHCLRHADEAPLARLPRGIAFAYLPEWLLALADSQR